MPIITTPGQQVPPVQKQDPTTTPSPRLQSAFTPTPVQQVTQVPQAQPAPIVTPQPSKEATITPELDDFDELPLDDANDSGESVTSAPFGTPNPALSLSRMSEADRRRVITNVFMLVLGKNPADRDFSYYRFSTLTEDGLTKSLLNLPEHKKLMEKAHEHTSLKQGVSELDMQVKQLTASMDSMKQELITMQQLLVEKNRYIQQMRGIPDIQPVVPQLTVSPTAQPQQITVPQVTSKNSYSIETRKLPGPMDELKSLLKGFFSGNK